MPTVSAAQALQDLKSSPTQYISTGLSLLDALLQNKEPVVTGNEQLFGGLSKGRVTEIYGPPGVGKTTLGFVVEYPFFLSFTDRLLVCSWLPARCMLVKALSG